MQIFQVRTVVV